MKKIELTDNEVNTLQNLISNFLHIINYKIDYDTYSYAGSGTIKESALADLVYIAQELYDGNFLDMVEGILSVEEFEEFEKLYEED